MKNCETCGVEVNVVMTPFADEVTGFIGEDGITCLKCAGLVQDSTDGELADEMGLTLRDDDAIYEGDYEPLGWHDDPQWDD